MITKPKKLHVLVIPSWYPNGEDKLMGVYHIDFCKALVKSGRCKVNMLYIDRQRISQPLKYFAMSKSFLDAYDGFRVYGTRMLDISKLSFDLEMKSYAQKLFSAYKKYEAAEGKPDVIHAQVAVPAGWACCVLGEKIGVPVMLTEHCSAYRRFFEGIEAPYNAKVMKEAKITCVGKFMVDFYAQKGIKAQVLPNIVSCGDFNEIRALRPQGRFNLITVCALREGKGIHYAIDAVKALRKEIPQIHYTVVGDGDYEAFYKKHMEETGTQNLVTFVGRKNHKEIAKLFTEMDAMVVPSDFETFGIPALEALAAGIPVVSTRNSGTEAFLNEGTGVLCNTKDVPDLVRAIRELYQNYSRFQADELKAVAAGFDSSRVANMACAYYEQL